MNGGHAMQNDHMVTLLCKNIRYLRKKNHLTQKEMAEIVGTSISSIRRIEQGTNIPRIHSGMLYRLCVHFNISADAMLNILLEDA